MSNTRYISPEKSLFVKPKNGIMTYLFQTESIRTYSIPKNAGDLIRFIAFFNKQRRIIKNLAEIAKCLNDLSKKNQPFIWSKQCQIHSNFLNQNAIPKI